MSAADPLLLIAFCVSAGFLWVAAETGVLAGSRGGRLGRALPMVAALFAACGLWWPGRALPAPPMFGGGADGWLLVAHLPGLLLCGCASLTGS